MILGMIIIPLTFFALLGAFILAIGFGFMSSEDELRGRRQKSDLDIFREAIKRAAANGTLFRKVSPYRNGYEDDPPEA